MKKTILLKNINRCIYSLLFINLILLFRFDYANAYTSFDNIPVWRLQIEILTGTWTEANTDDRVWVIINGQKIHLDSPSDDWEKGVYQRYDLVVDPSNSNNWTIGKLAQANWVVGKDGTDAWGIKRINVYVNYSVENDAAWKILTAPIYRHVYQDGNYIDSNDGHPKTLALNLKNKQENPNWNHPDVLARLHDTSGKIRYPKILGFSHIEGYIQGLIMDYKYYHDQDLRWHGGASQFGVKPIYINGIKGARFYCEMRSHEDYMADPSVNIKVDFLCSITRYQIDFGVEDVDVDIDTNWIGDLYQFLQGYEFDDEIEANIKQFTGIMSIRGVYPISVTATDKGFVFTIN